MFLNNVKIDEIIINKLTIINVLNLPKRSTIEPANGEINADVKNIKDIIQDK